MNIFKNNFGFMYDIKIFLENDGKYGARLNFGKEYVYAVGDNQNELMENLKEGFLLSIQNKKININTSRLLEYFNSNNNSDICH